MHCTLQCTHFTCNLKCILSRVYVCKKVAGKKSLWKEKIEIETWEKTS